MRKMRATAIALVAMFIVALMPAPSAMAHGGCRASDKWNEGIAGFDLEAVWTCDENHYKYKIRSYVQTRLGPGTSWYNWTGYTAVATKYQTKFIEDNRGHVECIPGVNPFAQWRVVIDYAHVWNQNLTLLADHSTEGWIGPNHTFNCQ